MTGNMEKTDVITIDMFNKLTGRETLHPLVGLADLSGDELCDDVCMPCNFYALIYRQGAGRSQNTMQLINPGEEFMIPSAIHRREKGYVGVLFHPDLLCDTPLERCIDRYPVRCGCCNASLTERENQTIADCLQEIAGVAPCH